MLRSYTNQPVRAGFWERANFMYRLPRLLSLYRRLWQDGRVPIIAKALPVLALIYIILPLDVIADYIPVLGQLDDAGILLLALRGFTHLTPAYVVDEHAEAVGLKSRHA
jgi:uncharacterized membrane protein YkvA (DUF1232 family)